jgi:putative transcriptional regulator
VPTWLSGSLTPIFLSVLNITNGKIADIMKNNLRVERAIKNITQQELAKIVGVSRQTINSIESNKYVLSTVLALKISEYFSKPVNEIFFLSEEDRD